MIKKNTHSKNYMIWVIIKAASHRRVNNHVCCRGEGMVNKSSTWEGGGVKLEKQKSPITLLADNTQGLITQSPSRFCSTIPGNWACYTWTTLASRSIPLLENKECLPSLPLGLSRFNRLAFSNDHWPGGGMNLIGELKTDSILRWFSPFFNFGK